MITRRNITTKRVEVERSIMMNIAEDMEKTMRIMKTGRNREIFMNMRQSITLFRTAINIRESYELCQFTFLFILLSN